MPLKLYMDEYEKKAREVIEQIQHLIVDTRVYKQNRFHIEFYLSILKSEVVSFDFFNEIYQKMITLINDKNTSVMWIILQPYEKNRFCKN